MNFTWQAGLSVILWSFTLGVAAIPPVTVLGWLWGVLLNHLASYKRARSKGEDLIPPSSSGT